MGLNIPVEGKIGPREKLGRFSENLKQTAVEWVECPYCVPARSGPANSKILVHRGCKTKMLAFLRFCAKIFHPLPCTKPPHTLFCTFLLLKVLGHRPARPTRMDQKSMEALEEEDLTFLQQYKTPLKKDRKAVREVSLETFQKLDLEATKERKPVRPRRSSTNLIPLHKIPAPPRRVKFTKVEMKELMAKRKRENSRIRANPTKRGKFKLVPSQLSKDKSPDYPPELRLSVVHHLLNTKVRARGGSWFCLACLINTCASPSFPHMFSPLLFCSATATCQNTRFSS
jgi:hypothetical protein